MMYFLYNAQSTRLSLEKQAYEHQGYEFTSEMWSGTMKKPQTQDYILYLRRMIVGHTHKRIYARATFALGSFAAIPVLNVLYT
jgi:hypothetical protein